MGKKKTMDDAIKEFLSKEMPPAPVPQGEHFIVSSDPWGMNVVQVFNSFEQANTMVKEVREEYQEATPSLWVVDIDEDGNETRKQPVVFM